MTFQDGEGAVIADVFFAGRSAFLHFGVSLSLPCPEGGRPASQGSFLATGLPLGRRESGSRMERRGGIVIAPRRYLVCHPASGMPPAERQMGPPLRPVLELRRLTNEVHPM